jgi:H/ACA ribonucleoprotein complex subunit 1
MGKFVHDVENEMLCESINTKIPYFNAPVYLENKVRMLAVSHLTPQANRDNRHLLAKSMRSSAR